VPNCSGQDTESNGAGARGKCVAREFGGKERKNRSSRRGLRGRFRGETRERIRGYERDGLL
jgi:hypothetical protein